MVMVEWLQQLELYQLKSKYISNNEIKREYTTDGIHLNHKGYEIFNSILYKEVEKRS